jgi:hypothetical protein
VHEEYFLLARPPGYEAGQLAPITACQYAADTQGLEGNVVKINIFSVAVIFLFFPALCVLDILLRLQLYTRLSIRSIFFLISDHEAVSDDAGLVSHLLGGAWGSSGDMAQCH